MLAASPWTNMLTTKAYYGMHKQNLLPGFKCHQEQINLVSSMARELQSILGSLAHANAPQSQALQWIELDATEMP